MNQSPKGPFAYVVGADGKAVVRLLTVAATQDVNAVIQRGLSPGETVVTDGQMSLAPGMPVSVHGQAVGQAKPGRTKAKPS